MVAVKLFLVLSLTVVATFAAPTVHVFVVFGQSNSVGTNSDGHTNEDVSYDNILQASCCVNGTAVNDKCQLIVGQDPLHHQCDSSYLKSARVGYGMSFARQYRSEMAAGDVIVLVPAGIGGTGFVDNVWTAYTGTGFVKAVARIKSTFTAIAKQYPQHTAVLEAFLWHQGETDADVNTSTNDYLSADIIPMIAAWRDTSLIAQSNAKTPFVVGNLVPTWVQDPAHTQRLGVFIALQVLDMYVPYSNVVPSLGLPADPASTIHFTAVAQREFGRRYYRGWQAAKLNGPVS